MGQIKWQKIHRFEGNISQCLGAECSDSCCLKKTLFLDQTIVKATTTFWDVNEWKYLIHKVPELRKGQIEIERLRGETRNLVLMTDCLQEGNCVPGSFRPVICKIHPFTVLPWQPIDKNCPKWREIGANSEIVMDVLKIRSLLGLEKTNKKWLKRLRKNLDE